MSSVPKSEVRMTAAEYLAWERQETEGHEFLAGKVLLRAGGSRNHSLIAANFLSCAGNGLKGHNCEVHGSDLRIHVAETGLYAYPDVSVVCPPVEGESDDVISNPVLLAEVLSPSTADYDRGGKFGHYRRIPALREYLVIWQDEARVEQHQKTSDGLWLLREVVGLDQTLNLTSLGLSISLRDVYARVDFGQENVAS